MALDHGHKESFLSLFERSFSDPDERASLGEIDKYLSRGYDEPGYAGNIDGIVLPDDRVVGLCVYDTADASFRSIEAPVSFLWYAAVDPAARRGGLLRRMVRRSEKVAGAQARAFSYDGANAGYEGILATLIEVNDPAKMGIADTDMDPLEREAAWKRLGFVKVEGFDYRAPESGEFGAVLYTSLHMKPAEGSRLAADGIRASELDAMVRSLVRDGYEIEKYTTNPQWQYMHNQLRRQGDRTILRFS